MDKAKTNFETFLPHVLKSSISIILLLIVWAVIVNLPMLREIRTPLPFLLDELFGAVILTALVIVLLRFGKNLGEYLSDLVPKFPQCGEIAVKIILLVTILILYYGYMPIIVPYLIYFGNLQWIYHVLFLVIFLIVLGITASILYKNSDSVASLFSGAKVGGMVTKAKLMCSSCEKDNDSGASFCSFCGTSLPQPIKCAECGTTLMDADSFCMNCGSKRAETILKEQKISTDVQTDSATQQKNDITTATTEELKLNDLRRCPFCNEEINAKAIKCKHCKSELDNN